MADPKRAIQNTALQQLIRE